jgi:serine/alanine adding enzyme
MIFGPSPRIPASTRPDDHTNGHSDPGALPWPSPEPGVFIPREGGLPGVCSPTPLPPTLTRPGQMRVCVYEGSEIINHLPRLENYLSLRKNVPLSLHPVWPLVLSRGLDHTPFWLEVLKDGRCCGLVCLAYVRSVLFGRFLVSLPYLNYGGILADDPAAARLLIDRAVELADELKVRYLELRHRLAIEHPSLGDKATGKVNMHLALPGSAEELWMRLPCKVRNEVRKAKKHDFAVTWGSHDLLADFHHVFSRNMRDLGTPVYSRRVFQSILDHFPQRAEICVVRAAARPIAAGILLHGWGVTEVPSASSLRSYNHTCANMLMYWHLLERAIERKQAVFDFGRCTPHGNTYRFKTQWGAKPERTEWQFYLRHGRIGEMNPSNPRFERHVRRWQRLPVWVTRILGPRIVRGIP